jgi:hypothetical protein
MSQVQKGTYDIAVSQKRVKVLKEQQPSSFGLLLRLPIKNHRMPGYGCNRVKYPKTQRRALLLTRAFRLL